MKNLKIMNAIVICVAWMGLATATPAIWDGSADVSWFNANAQTYNLTTAEQLAGLAKLVNDGTSDFQGKTITLGADIFLNDTAGAGDDSWYKKSHRKWTPIGSISRPFMGEFDALAGKENRKIYGLYINEDTSDYAGLFGYTDQVKISNLDVRVGFINAKNYVGSIVGFARGAIITNVHSNIDVVGQNCVGGLLGFLKGKISEGSVDADVFGKDSVGGVLGYSSTNVSLLNHSGKVNGNAYVGGVAGYTTGTLSSVHHIGGNIKGESYVGGLAGYSGRIDSSYSNGNVKGNSYVGGLFGRGGSIYASYAVGHVQGDFDYIGGVAGYAGGMLRLVYHVGGDVNGNSYVGGLAGYSRQIDLSYSEGSVIGEKNYVGGIAGYVIGGVDSTYHKNGDVKGYAYVGGLIGVASSATYSFSEGNVVGLGDCVGGMAGQVSDSVINSHSIGKVESNGRYVGGLIGMSYYYYNGKENKTIRSVYNSYAVGDVSGDSYVGGLVGLDSIYNGDSIRVLTWWGDSVFKDTVKTTSVITKMICNSYSKGVVTGKGNYVGGVIGKANYMYGVMNYYMPMDSVFHVEGDVKGDSYVGGVAGQLAGFITNSYSEGDVLGNGDYIGGLAGLMWYSFQLYGDYLEHEHIRTMKRAENSYAVGNVVGKKYVGGLVGYDFVYSDTILYKRPSFESYQKIYHNSYFKGGVEGKEMYVGGLLGLSDYAQTNVDSSFFDGLFVVGNTFVGGLVGDAYKLEINYSYSKGNVKGVGDYVGGLAGRAYFVIGSYSEGNVEGGGYVGGIVGDLPKINSEGILRNTHSVGNVFGTGNYVGGIAGHADISSINPIDSSYHIGGFVSGMSYVGGLVGQTSIITNSYSEGTVSGTGDYVGGLAGNSGSVRNSRFVGNVVGKGDYIGGLAGVAWTKIDSSFYKGNVTGNNLVGGLTGYARTISHSQSEGNVIGLQDKVGGVAGNALYVEDVYHINGDVIGKNRVGGIIGIGGLETDGYIKNSYSIGNVSGIDSVGGLTGGCSFEIYDSYAIAGFVKGTNFVGGLTGCSKKIISRSYFIGDSVIGTSQVGGFVGVANGKIDSSYAIVGYIRGDNSVGGFVGVLNNSLTNSYASFSAVDSVIGKNNVGGFIGVLNGSVDSSYSMANVKGDDNVGGLIGSSYGNISNSYALGNVVGDVDHSSAGNDNLGGLVGYAYKGSISKSFAKGNVSGTSKLGGLVGRFDGSSITQSHANGNVTGVYYGNPADEVGNFYIGGLVGYAKGAVSESYASGIVKGVDEDPVYTGCLIGYVDGSLTIDDSYFDNEKCSLSIEGKNGSKTAGATVTNSFGKTTAEMQNEMTFANWDFSNTWNILENSYPFLFFFANSFVNAVVTTEPLENMVYDSVPKNPAVTSIELGGAALTENVDYQVSYQNNIDAGTASIKVCGLGSYSGCKIIPFIIAPVSLKITLGKIENQVYDTFEKTPAISIYEGETLLDDVGFSTVFTNNVKAGIASVEVSLTGNFSGSASATFMIEKAKSIVGEFPTAGEIFYGQTLEKSNLEGGSANIEGSFVWSKKDIVPSPVNDGYEVTFVPKDTSNYLGSTAKVSLIVKKCIVSFTYEGTVLQIDSLMYGDLPGFYGDLPKKNSAQFEYTFKTWSPKIVAATGNQNYVAVFDSTLRKYTVSFYSGDSLLQSSEAEYGSIPTFKGSNPQKEESDNYTYVFKEWSPTIVAVTEPASYKAVYDSTKIVISSSSSNIASSSSKIQSSSSSSSAKSSSSKGNVPIVMQNETPQFSVSVNFRSLQIAGAKVGTSYALLDLQGRVLQKGRVESANFNIAVPQSGSYLVRINKQTKRVDVK